MSISIVFTPLEGWSHPIVARPFLRGSGKKTNTSVQCSGNTSWQERISRPCLLEHSLLMQSCSWNTIVSNVGGVANLKFHCPLLCFQEAIGGCG